MAGGAEMAGGAGMAGGRLVSAADLTAMMNDILLQITNDSFVALSLTIGGITNDPRNRPVE